MLHEQWLKENHAEKNVELFAEDLNRDSELEHTGWWDWDPEQERHAHYLQPTNGKSYTRVYENALTFML